MPKSLAVVRVATIQERILTIRDRKVILGADLEEKREVVAKCDRLERLKLSRALPLVFSEHGAIMAASVLSSQTAVEVSVFVVRAFVELRRMFTAHEQISRKVAELEKHLADHDGQILLLVQAIKKLAGHDQRQSPRRIGYDMEK
jgi:hypothetical protein